MQSYIGAKIIQAEPCNAWQRSGNYDIGAPGYKVVYPDGYTSWSPKEVFENAYRPITVQEQELIFPDETTEQENPN